MTRLDWNARGERFYEAGVDRGVLYVGSDPGVAWTGLISVSESPSGGGPQPYYIDGIKYLNLADAEEFEATVTALGSPKEFGPCDGTLEIHNGLFATQQRRAQFGLSYRTRIGNDVIGDELGYKIHLVYNALSGPSDRENRTRGDSAEPSTFSWPITTLPPAITGYKRTAHLVIDTRYTDPEVLTEIEDILYGDESVSARLPLPDEIVDIFAP